MVPKTLQESLKLINLKEVIANNIQSAAMPGTCHNTHKFLS
jgi:hypothetical protein